MREEIKQSACRALMKMSDKLFWLALALLNGFAAQAENKAASVIIICVSGVAMLAVFFVIEASKEYKAARPGTIYAITKLQDIKEIGQKFLNECLAYELPPSHLPVNAVPGIDNLASPGITKAREWADSVSSALGSVGMRDMANLFLEDAPEITRYYQENSEGRKEWREYVKYMRHRLCRLDEILMQLSSAPRMAMNPASPTSPSLPS